MIVGLDAQGAAQEDVEARGVRARAVEDRVALGEEERAAAREHRALDVREAVEGRARAQRARRLLVAHQRCDDSRQVDEPRGGLGARRLPDALTRLVEEEEPDGAPAAAVGRPARREVGAGDALLAHPSRHLGLRHARCGRRCGRGRLLRGGREWAWWRLPPGRAHDLADAWQWRCADPQSTRARHGRARPVRRVHERRRAHGAREERRLRVRVVVLVMVVAVTVVR